LASDARAGSWARGQARRAHRKYVRKHWRLMLVVTCGMGALTAITAFLVRQELVRGIVIGAGLTGTLALLGYGVTFFAGTGPTLMGELAEQWTASELRKLQQRGWRVVNHFGLGHGDIDHVAIGPCGVFVIETKWSASPWADPDHRARVARAVERTTASARQLKMWHDYKQLGLPDPRPVVLIWGEGADDVTATHNGATVLPGHNATEWFTDLADGVLRDEDIHTVWSKLDVQARKRDRYEEQRTPIPPSVHGQAALVFAAVGTGMLGFLVAAELMKVIHPLALWVLAIVGLGIAALPVRRWRPAVAGLALGWQSGLAGTLMLAAAVTGEILLR
jgi:F0F1-type ATP synthase assembly protein I